MPGSGIPSPTANLVAGNLIGTSATGDSPIPNGAGITLSAGSQGNTIGGSAAAGNLIADNTDAGVEVLDQAVDNPILANLIYGNGGLAIDLEGDGNHLQNYPVVVTASDGSL